MCSISRRQRDGEGFHHGMRFRFNSDHAPSTTTTTTITRIAANFILVQCICLTMLMLLPMHAFDLVRTPDRGRLVGPPCHESNRYGGSHGHPTVPESYEGITTKVHSCSACLSDTVTVIPRRILSLFGTACQATYSRPPTAHHKPQRFVIPSGL